MNNILQSRITTFCLALAVVSSFSFLDVLAQERSAEVKAELKNQKEELAAAPISEPVAETAEVKNPDPEELTQALYAKDGLFGEFSPEMEDVASRSENAKHFFNGDGTSTAILGAGDVHYLENGVWKSILPYLFANDNPQFPQYKYASKYNQHKTYFPEVPGNGIATTLKDGVYADWEAPTLVWLNAEKQIIGEASVASSTSALPEENRLVYEEIFPNIDAEIVNSSRTKKLNYFLKSQSVLDGKPAQAVYLAFKENINTPTSWKFNGDKEVNQIWFQDGSGKDVLVVQRPVFSDRISQGSCDEVGFDSSINNEDQFIQGDYLVNKVGQNAYEVFTLVPVNWLSAPHRKFPLTIDPTTNYYPGFTWPTYTAYRSGNSGSWACNTGAYGGRTYPNSDISYGWVDTSWPTSNPYLDGYASFNLSSLADDVCLNSVSYYWYRYGGRTCDDQIRLKLGMVASNINLGNEPNCNITGQAIRNNNAYYNGTGLNGSGWHNRTGNLTDLSNALPVNQITIGWAYNGGDDCCTGCVFGACACTGNDGDYHNVYGFEHPTAKPYARITYETRSTTPTGISGSTTVCAGGSTTLTATGGTLGSNSSYQWYANGCGSGSVLGTGASLTVTPSSTTTYYVRRTGPCNTTSCRSVTVTRLPAFNPGSISGGGGTQCSPANPGAMTVSPSGGTGTYTYQWYYKNGTSCPSTGGAQIISGATSATYDPPAGLTTTRSYQVQVNPAGSPDCGGPVWSSNCITVTVNPLPVASVTNSAPVICNNGSTNISLSSSIGGSTFSYSASGSNGNIGGYSNGSVNPIVQTLTNSGSVPGTVTYSIVPTVTSTGCSGDAVTAIVTVNPVPNVVATPSISTICSGESTSISLTSSVSGASFSWVPSSPNPQVGGYGANSGTTISQTLTNTGSVQGAVTYDISSSANNCPGTSTTATVNVNPLPQGAIIGSTTTCTADNATLTFNFLYGTPPYDVVYSDGTNTYTLNDINSGHTVVVNPTTTTTYSLVSIIDDAGNGCTRTSSFSASATVTVNELPDGTVSGATTICEGDAASLTFNFTAGTGPYDVVYSDGSTTYSLSNISDGHTVSVSPLTTTTYSIAQITDDNTCVNSAVASTTTITVNPKPNGSISLITPICFGDQTTLTFNFAPGTGPFDIAFTDGVSNFSLTGVNDGDTYVVTPPTSVTYSFTSITDANTCVRTSGFTGNALVIVNPLPTVSFSGLAANYCELDNPVVITGNQAPGGTFSGSGITDLANGTANFSPGAAGVGTHTITYTFTDINSCTNSADQTVSVEVQPVADAGTGGDECDLNFDLGANPSVAAGTWTQTAGPGFSNFVPNANDPTATVSVSQYGTYEFTWSEGIYCSSSDAVTVNFYEQPVANAGANGNECDLDHVFNAVPSVGNGTWTQLSGPGTSSYVDATSPTTTVTATLNGQYVYQWEEVNGTCSDAATVTVNYFEQPVANPGFGGSECDLDFQLGAVPSVGNGSWSATGPGTITFTPSATDPNAVAEVSTYGIYIFTWSEDNFGCTDDASITVNFDQQTNANAGDDGNECDLNFTFNGSPSIGTGVWTYTGLGNAFFSNPNSPTATVTVDTYGSYIFTWTETNGTCVATDIATVNFYEQPVANAGSDSDECDLNHVFDAVPSVGNGLWLQTNGPGTSTFLVDSDPTTTVTVDQYGTYTYSWTETNGTCSDNATVVVSYYEQPVANAGVGGNECDLDFSLTGVASVGVGLWTATGPGTATFANDLSASTDVSVSAYGTYTFTWTETSGTCSDAASVTVNFYEQPVAVTGPGGDECDLTFLTGAVPSVGTGLWTQTAGPGTATFSSATSAINVITVDTYGTYEFTWTETNGTCVDFRTITVNFYEEPVADAGLGGDECDLDFTLAANPSVGAGEWTYTGPGTATFGSSTSASTTVTVSQSGVYTFTWTETNGVCSDADDVTVTFYDQPVADAGTGGDECDLNFTFSAVPSYGTGTWTYSGPGTASFTNANGATSTVTVDTYGTYLFTWTEVNGICSDAASVTVNFYEQPVANAGTGTNQCDLDFTFNGSASVGVGTWTYTGPGTATFSPNENDVNATVMVDATGSYTFTWTEDNNGCTDSDDVTVDFNPLPVVSFTGLDSQYCVDYSTPVALTGTPAGGTFSGLGVSGNSFVPSVAGVGTIFVTYTYTDVNGCTDSETQSVDVNGLPTVSFSGLASSYCEDDATAYTLSGTPVGGTFTGSGVVNDQFTPLDANNGNHVITYTYSDPFGCTSSEQQAVTVNELPVVSFTGLSAAYCEDASNAALTGSPSGGTFSGPGIIGNSFSAVSAGTGTHTIVYTYTDGNGCTNTSSQQVVVNDVPVPSITPAGTTEICAGESLTLDAGTGFASYAWSNGGSGQSISVNTADDYSVTVTTSAGCVGTSPDVTVVVNALPVVDLGPDTIVCTGSVYTIDAGNPGMDYAWSTFEITQTITVSTTGNYEVAVTDQNGCTGTDEILVSVSSLLEPVIVANGPVEFCAGGSVVLDGGAGYGSYQWSTGATSQTITVSTPGLYEVTVVDQYGCSGVDEEVVSVLQLPNAVIQPGGSIEICSSDTLTLSASNTFASYEWNPGGATSTSIEVWQSGTYTVTVTDPNNGCVATSDPVSVIVNSSTPPTIVPSGATEFCDGESVSLSVAPGPYSSFLWSSGSTTPSIVVTQTGDYGVTVLDANGCLDSTLQGNPLHVEVWDPQPQVAQQGDTLVVVNGPFVQYQWYFNGNPIPGAVADFHVPAQSGNYHVEAWDGNDCSGNSFNIEYTFTGITDLTNIYNIKVYPNPTNGTFYLEVDFGKHVSGEVSLSDITGRAIMVPEKVSDVSSIRRQFDIEHLSLGVYYLRLMTQDGVAVVSVLRN